MADLVVRLPDGTDKRIALSDRPLTVGRSAVLRSLLDRPHLFAPGLGLHDWEQRARANIAAELATLVE